MMNRLRFGRSVDFRTQILLHFCCLYGLTFLILLPISCYKLKHSVFYWRDDPSTWVDLRHLDEMRLFTGEHLLSSMRLKQKLPWHFDHSRYHGKYANGEPNPHGIDLHVIIVTVNRNSHRVDKYEPRYLTQTVTSFLSQFEEDFLTHSDDYRRVNITVCNVESEPKFYTEAQRMAYYVDVINRYDSDVANSSSARKVEPIRDRKIIEDFVYCVANSVQRYRNRLVLVLQDDMLPTEPDFVRKFRLLVDSLLPSALGEFYSLNVGLVKLHHSTGQLGFSDLPAGDLFMLFFTLLSSSALVTLLYFRFVLGLVHRRERRESDSMELPSTSTAANRSQHYRVLSTYEAFDRGGRPANNSTSTSRSRKQSNLMRRFVMCTGAVFVYAVLVCVSIGAPSVVRHRRWYMPFGSDHVLVGNAFGCCYRALLFSELSAREFVEFASRTLHISYHFDESLQRITDGFDEDYAAHVVANHGHENNGQEPVATETYTLNSLLNAFVAAGTFRSFSLLPNVMQHIGLYPAYADQLRSTEEIDW